MQNFIHCDLSAAYEYAISNCFKIPIKIVSIEGFVLLFIQRIVFQSINSALTKSCCFRIAISYDAIHSHTCITVQNNVARM